MPRHRTRTHRTRRRGAEARRATSLLAVVLTAASALASVAASGITNPAQAAELSWACSTSGYLVRNPGDTHTISEVDLASGATQPAANVAGDIDAVGYNDQDGYLYGWDSATHTLVQIHADGTATDLGVPPGMSGADAQRSYVAGDVAGNEYVVYGQGHWFVIDLTTDLEQVLDSGTASLPSGVIAIGDWAQIDGAYYAIGQTGGAAAALVRFVPSDGAFEVVAQLPQLPGADTFGATYADAAHNLYAADDRTGDIYRIAWRDGALSDETILVSTSGPTSGSTDGARCASASMPTITVTKRAVRSAENDQFTVGLNNDAGDVLTSATTRGGEDSTSTTDWPVSPGATYTVTDAVADGSTNGLGAYLPTIACTDTVTGDPVSARGSAPNWTVTASETNPISCTVTNKPAPPTWGCDAFGYLFQSTSWPPTQGTHTVQRVDLATGAASPFGTTADYVIAIGYNTLDNFFYGWDGSSQQLVRINRDRSLTELARRWRRPASPAGCRPTTT